MKRRDKRRLLNELPFFDPEEKGFVRFNYARSLVLPLRITSTGKYRKEIRGGRLSGKRLPVNPQVVYASSGWNGWDDFFGMGMTYEYAVIAVMGLRITSSSSYREARESGLLPYGMPKNPASFFKDRWGGWGAFLRCISTFDERSRRTKDGIQRARLNGKKIGRPTVNRERIQEAKSLHEQGLSYSMMSKRMGISRSRAYQLVHLP